MTENRDEEERDKTAGVEGRQIKMRQKSAEAGRLSANLSKHDTNEHVSFQHKIIAVQLPNMIRKLRVTAKCHCERPTLLFDDKNQEHCCWLILMCKSICFLKIISQKGVMNEQWDSQLLQTFKLKLDSPKPFGFFCSLCLNGWKHSVNAWTISEVCCLYFWLQFSQWATHLPSHFPSPWLLLFSLFPSSCSISRDLAAQSNYGFTWLCPWVVQVAILVTIFF